MNKRHKKLSIMIAAVFVGLFIPFPLASTDAEILPFQTVYKESLELELGDERVDAQGALGEERVTYESRGSLITRLLEVGTERREVGSRTIMAPANRVVTKGVKRWQYMLCTDGGHRYFTDEQMKDKNTGFTSKSPDSCAENGQGVRASLADAPQTHAPYYNQPLYVPQYTYGYELPEIQIDPYQGTTPTYNPPALKEYKVPEPPKITTRPLNPAPARTCTYYQGNGVCF